MHELSVACFGERANSEAFIRQRYGGGGGPQVDVVVADVGGRIVGSQALTLFPFMIDGRSETAGMFTDGMTHPDHRKRGIFRVLLEAAEARAWERGVGLLFTMPNDESLPAFEKSAAWKVLPDRELFVLPVDMGGFLRDRGLPKLLAAPMGGCASLLLSAAWKGGVARVEEIGGLAPYAAELDGLARAAAQAYGGVMCLRDHAFLRWRFEGNPTWRYRYFISRDAAGTLDGYAVTTTERRMNTTISYVVDMLSVPDTAPLSGLLRLVAGTLRREGTRLLASITSSPLQAEALRRAGLRRLPDRIAPRKFHTAYALNPSRPDLASACARKDAWLLSLADFDTI